MTEQPPKVARQSDPERDSPPGMPRWVKIAALAVCALILVFLILQLTGVAGDHGPGRHMSGSAPQSSGVAGWTSVVGTVA